MSGPDVIWAGIGPHRGQHWEESRQTVEDFPECYLRKDGLPKEAIEALRECRKDVDSMREMAGVLGCGPGPLQAEHQAEEKELSAKLETIDALLSRWDKLEEGE